MKYCHFLTVLLATGLLTSVSLAESGPQEPSVIDKKKSFLRFFNENDTHSCPNCVGQVTVKALLGRNIKMANTTVYTHVCTKCGQNSAYTCAAHSKS